jgi:uncharacterized membrane protein YqiK
MVNLSMVLVVVIMCFAMIAMVVVYSIGYTTIPPNKVMVLFRGKREKGMKAQALISGGGRFIIPGGGSYPILDLTTDLVEFELNGVPTRSEGPPITIRLRVAVIWKITSDANTLKETAGKLVERTRGENKMAVKETVERAIRNFAPSMSIQEFEADREMLSRKIQPAVGELMNELGLEIRSFYILNIKRQG